MGDAVLEGHVVRQTGELPMQGVNTDFELSSERHLSLSERCYQKAPSFVKTSETKSLIPNSQSA